MSIFCKLGLHSAAADPRWNNGFYFSTCIHCRCDLVRGAQSCWQAVPKQLKVVWRPRPEGYPDWSGSAPEETPSRIFSPPVALAPPQTRLSTFVGRG